MLAPFVYGQSPMPSARYVPLPTKCAPVLVREEQVCGSRVRGGTEVVQSGFRHIAVRSKCRRNDRWIRSRRRGWVNFACRKTGEVFQKKDLFGELADFAVVKYFEKPKDGCWKRQRRFRKQWKPH